MPEQLSLEDLISGEKLQLLCNVTIGTPSDINYNPRIKSAVSNKEIEFMNIDNLAKLPQLGYNNPKYIFLYSHHIKRFGQLDILSKFANPFILITHNSDQNIEPGKYADNILACQNLIHWWAQNLNISESYSSKLSFLPIGIANSMWNHGKPDLYKKLFNSSGCNKSYDFYFSFAEGTNPGERGNCRRQVAKHGLVFQSSNLSPAEYISRLPEYKMAICPVGNGLDTHRLWECLYCGVVPIVARNALNENIAKYFPIIILDTWASFNLETVFAKYNEIINKYSIGDHPNDNHTSQLYWDTKNGPSHLWFSTWKKRILELE